jgi:phosphatidylethanolamine-binding protein (PEBP) family uncharacterized protein
VRCRQSSERSPWWGSGGPSTRRRGRRAISAAAVAGLAAVALSGCSNTSSGATNSLAAVKPIVLPISSSALHGRRLPALYSCDGRNISPPISWGALPSDVEELALFLVNTARDKEGRTVLSLDWGLAGLKPRLHGLRAGEIPPGAFELTGTHDGKKGYSVCPAHGEVVSYSLAIFALPAGARATRGMRAVSLLRNLTNQQTPQDESPASGSLTFVYRRG